MSETKGWTKNMKVLSIGNSFTQDANYYLHQIGEAAGVENELVNLVIGGCPLEKHWNNLQSGEKEYQVEINGVMIDPDRLVSIKEILVEKDWDVIVTQQASHDSGIKDSYEPFLGNMLAVFKECAPNAKVFINETWAYEPDSTHPCFDRYDHNTQKMYECLHDAYYTAAEKHDLPVIPSGTLIQKIRATEEYSNGTRSICRDGFHMDLIYGRYAVGCMWAKCIFGITLKGNDYIPETEYLPGVKPDQYIIDVIKEMVDDML